MRCSQYVVQCICIAYTVQVYNYQGFNYQLFYYQRLIINYSIINYLIINKSMLINSILQLLQLATFVVFVCGVLSRDLKLIYLNLQ